VSFPAPNTASKHAKSTSARDLRYGRRGGRWLPLLTDFEQAEAFAAAMAKGTVVEVCCLCTTWCLAPKQVGDICRSCDAPMGARRFVVLDEHPAACLPGCTLCSCSWTWHDGVIGSCAVCGFPCSTTDPTGAKRHPTCEIGAAA